MAEVAGHIVAAVAAVPMAAAAATVATMAATAGPTAIMGPRMGRAVGSKASQARLRLLRLLRLPGATPRCGAADSSPCRCLVGRVLADLGLRGAAGCEQQLRNRHQWHRQSQQVRLPCVRCCELLCALLWSICNQPMPALRPAHKLLVALCSNNVVTSQSTPPQQDNSQQSSQQQQQGPQQDDSRG